MVGSPLAREDRGGEARWPGELLKARESAEYTMRRGNVKRKGLRAPVCRLAAMCEADRPPPVDMTTLSRTRNFSGPHDPPPMARHMQAGWIGSGMPEISHDKLYARGVWGP